MNIKTISPTSLVTLFVLVMLFAGYYTVRAEGFGYTQLTTEQKQEIKELKMNGNFEAMKLKFEELGIEKPTGHSYSKEKEMNWEHKFSYEMKRDHSFSKKDFSSIHKEFANKIKTYNSFFRKDFFGMHEEFTSEKTEVHNKSNFFNKIKSWFNRNR